MTDYDDAVTPGNDLLSLLNPGDEAERRFLATMLWHDEPNALLQRIHLEPRHFLNTDYAAIFEAALTLRDRRVHVDVLSLAEHIADQQTEPVLWHLTDSWFGVGEPEFYADEVLARWRRRSVGELGDALKETAADTPGEYLDSAVRRQVDEVLTGTAAGSAPHTTDATLAERAFGPRTKVVSYPTPWPLLDRSIRGFRPGALYVIAGDTGLGKSALALQCAYALSQAGVVSYTSIEMAESEMQDRLIAQCAQVPLDFVERQHYPSAVMRARIETFVKRGSVPIAFHESADPTLDAIRAHALTCTQGKPLTGIVVDYLQLMNIPRGKGENLTDAIGRVTKGLKVLARDLDVPVILLSQLNREAARSGRPTRHHLLSSGSIGQDADVILLLWREDEQTPERLSLIVDKNRQGPEGILTLEWQGEFLRAVDRSVPGHQTYVD